MRRRRLVIASLLGASLAVNGLGTVVHAAAAPLSIFPNDSFTVADASQLTGRRVNMAMTNCAVQVSNCNEIALINALDGFDLDPNVKVRFSGPIDVSKVNGTNLYLERVCGCTRVARIPLVRLVWDPVPAPDLAGYVVFRAEGAGEPVRLTPESVKDNFLTDSTAKPGIRYRYTVRAVDTAGNMSPPSPEAIAEPL